MPDPPAISAPNDPKGAADLAKYLQGLFAPAQTGASGLLAQVAGPGGIYDPAQDLAALRTKSQLANTLPTQADIEAQTAGRQALGADELYRNLSGVPVPQEGLLEQPNLPQLNLPGPPATARPQVSPLASLLAIGAGFASPKSAGQFNAAALEGAIKGAEEENQRRQQRDKADIARRAMIYDASMSAAKEQQRIKEANRDAAFRNTVVSTDRQMLLARAKTEQFTAHGAADSLKAFAEKYDPALKARDEVKAMLDEIDARGKASSERVKSITELLGAVHKEDSAGPGMAKNVFDQIMESTRAAATQRAIEQRSVKVAGMQENAALQRARLQQEAEMARVNVIQGHEDARAFSDRKLRAALQGSAQQFDIKKMLLGDALKPQPREAALQSNLERQQTQLKGLENSLAEAKANLATTTDFATPVNNLTRRQWIQRVDQLEKEVRSRSDAMFKEQRSLEYEKRLRKKTLTSGSVGAYNPATGTVE